MSLPVDLPPRPIADAVMSLVDRGIGREDPQPQVDGQQIGQRLLVGVVRIEQPASQQHLAGQFAGQGGDQPLGVVKLRLGNQDAVGPFSIVVAGRPVEFHVLANLQRELPGGRAKKKHSRSKSRWASSGVPS